MSRIAPKAIYAIGAEGASRRESRATLAKAADPAHREMADLQESAGNNAVGTLLGAGAPLDPAVRADMEARFGEGFEDVRVHNDDTARRSTARLDAKAYTIGSDIAFAAERYAPHSAEGKRLLAHELAHVIQQRRGGAHPLLDAHAPHERSADLAADAIASGVGPVSVGGGTGVGIACDKDDEKEEEERRKQQANMTVVGQRPRPEPKLDLPVHEIDDPRKGKGTLAEANVPFDLYSGPDWNHLGGGEETKTSRISLARETKWGKTGGIDFLVENVRTGRLVIGEQKAVDKDAFEKATAITTNLEKNVSHAREQLQKQLDSGKVHPEEAARLQKSIAKLEATEKALQTHSDLPEGVVFELTNLSGKGKEVGKGHVELLAEKYGNDPKFMEHLLSRTFVRDPKLAKEKGRDAGGKRGTDADPDVVPATELLTPQARDELARLRSGKTQKQWRTQKESEKKDAQKKARDERAEETQKKREQRAAEERKAKDDAKKLGDKAMEREAGKAGKESEKQSFEKFKAQRKQQETDAKAKRQAEDQALQLQLKNQRDAEQRARQQREAQERQVREQKDAAARKAEEAGSLQTPERLRKLNDEARRRNESQRGDAKLTKAAHAANQLAGGIRAVDAFLDALDQDKGYLEAGYQAGKTFLENTNQVIGAIGTAEARQQKDPVTGEQYYGNDALDAWFGTLGETIAGYVVPGSGIDQLVNAGSNLTAAADDHLNRELDPSDPALKKASVRTLTDLAGELTPSRMFSQLVGGGARSYYDIGRAIGSDATGVDKFAEDAVRGKLGSIVQPWAMLADFAGNLGSDDAGTALEKAIKKTEGTTLKKLGDASGNAMYELGENEEAKQAKYGTSVQGISMILGAISDLNGGRSFEQAVNKQAELGKGTLADKIGGATGDALYKIGESKEAKAGNYGAEVQGFSMLLGAASDMIRGDSVEQALEKAAAAGKGSLADTVGSALGDAAFTGVEKGKEFINEDLPAAKKRLAKWWAKL